MSRQFIVFDIETAPLLWENFSESQQEYLLRGAKTEEEIEKKKFEMGLSPMTAQAVCIGMQLMEMDGDGWKMIKRAALAVDNSLDEKGHIIEKLSGGEDCHVYNESVMLENFWSVLSKYSAASLISFNGRNFDAPFLMLRSALLKIRPTRNLMSGTKFNYSMHSDLLDELTFFAGSNYGATRRFNFDFYARAFGITSPKSAGVDGSMVGAMFNEGKIVEIAEYCLRDVSATWELYLVWNKYIKF